MTRPLRPGDGIIHLLTGKFHFIKAIVTRGDNQYGRDPNEVLGYVVDRPFGVITLYHGQYRRATFMEYVNNDTGFGKTKWPRFISSVALLLTIGIYCLATRSEFDPVWSRYAAAAFCLVLVPGAWGWATWMNWRGRWV